ncbi:MAG: SRPBCC family protein [Gemmatimonadaceae bacterium]|nr:SRPBCC family protein [Gemmatimonadaceae bacterium]
MRKIGIGVGIVVGLVVLAAGVLLAMGRRDGAGRNDASIEISRPPAVVYAWISEPAKLTQWVDWLVEVRQDPPGPDGVVRREVWVMDDPNTKARMELVSTMLRVDAPRFVSASVGLPGLFDGEVSYELTDLGNGRTRLDYRSHFTYGPWHYRLLEPLVTPEAQRKLETDLAALKRLAEAAPAGA